MVLGSHHKKLFTFDPTKKISQKLHRKLKRELQMVELKEMTAITEVEGVQLFKLLSENNHEEVVYCFDKETGLKAIVAVHNTVLGPALGGLRVWSYQSESEALIDVLRLSRGMTYKAAISGLNLGGGKAVIIADSKKDKTEAMFRKFGRFVENLNGKYITAEDVGTSTKDMEYIKMETDHVCGLPESMGGGGDPSPVTAYGVYMGMKASARQVWGTDKLAGKKVVVQGVGHVGENLVKHLTNDGAIVFVADINQDALANISKNYKAQVVKNEDVFSLDVDIYAPCALGATLNSVTIPQLKCAIVSGAANNQLADENEHGKMLLDRGILYAPDFLINAGGLINVYQELQGYNRDRAMRATETIYDVTTNIFKKAKEENISTQEAAKRLAEKRINDIGKVRSTY